MFTFRHLGQRFDLFLLLFFFSLQLSNDFFLFIPLLIVCFGSIEQCFLPQLQNKSIGK